MDFARLIFAMLAAVIFAASAAAYSNEAVKDAEDFVKRIHDRFTAGEVTSTDVAQAEYHLLEMKYRARADLAADLLPGGFADFGEPREGPRG